MLPGSLFCFKILESSFTLPTPADSYHGYRSSSMLPAHMATWIGKALVTSGKSMGKMGKID